MTIKKRASARSKSTRNQSDLSEPNFAPIELALQNIGQGEVLLQRYIQSELAVSCNDGGVGVDEEPLDYSFRRLEPGEAVYTGGTGESYDFAFVVSRDETRGNKVVTFVIEERGIHKPEDSIGEALSWVASGLSFARDRAPSNDQVLCILNLLLNAPDVGPDRWVKTKDATLRLDLAGNPLMPTSALEQLARQKSAAVRLAIAENPAAPNDLRRRILHELVDASKPDIRVGVAQNALTDVKDLKNLSTDDDEQVLIAVANNPAASSELRGRVHRKLAKSCDPAVLLRLATSPDAPASVFSRLLTCTDERVIAAIAENVVAPETVRSAALKRISKSGDPAAKRALALNPLTTPSILKRLVSELDSQLNTAIAQNSATPCEVLESLARCDDLNVLCGVAGNPATPALVLMFLAKKITRDQDDDELVRGVVAQNLATPAEALKILAKDKAEQVREYIAKNRSTPDSTLVALAKDKEYSVRESLAKRAFVPTAALEILAKDRYDNIRMYVARNLGSSADVLIALAKDQYHAVRRDVALNPGLPKSVLSVLISDEDSDVRRAAEKAQARAAF